MAMSTTVVPMSAVRAVMYCASMVMMANVEPPQQSCGKRPNGADAETIEKNVRRLHLAVPPSV
jgi:hypothetical protein